MDLTDNRSTPYRYRRTSVFLPPNYHAVSAGIGNAVSARTDNAVSARTDTALSACQSINISECCLSAVYTTVHTFSVHRPARYAHDG